MGERVEAKVADEPETTRYNALPEPVKAFFLALTAIGLGAAVVYIFNISIMGEIMLEAGYLYLLIGIFGGSVFLLLPAHKGAVKLPWYDLLAALAIMGICFYFFLNANIITYGKWSHPTTGNFILALLLAVLLLEGGRRMGGPIYAAVCVIFGFFPLVAESMPGVLNGVEYSLNNLIGMLAFESNGLIGIATKAMARILLGFLLFAGVLVATGAGQFFLDFATAIFGRFRGGPAKVAVVASGFFGSLSGSTFSNIVATGSFTIPAMKRMGYPAHYAGAIEACASTGGMLMPPVMGAVAFIMAELLGVDYVTIIIAAAIPAILYYFGLLMQVDAYAARVGLKGLPPDEIPSVRKTLAKGWSFFIVFVFLLWGLLYMRWEEMTPFYASALMFVLSFARKETRFTPSRVVHTLGTVGKLIVQSFAILLPIGLVINGLTITGVSASFTAGLVHLGGGNLFLVLLMGVLACYIMGMAGLIIAAYIFVAITMAPAVIQIGGLNVLAVHLFIIYYEMLSAITPPVAAGAFLGATIAGAAPMKTAWTAMRLGVVIYFIPFFFIFNPALILNGNSLWESLYLFVLCLVGVVFIAAGMEGYMLKIGRLGAWPRPLLVIAGVLIGYPEWITTYIGAALVAVVIGLLLAGRKQPASPLSGGAAVI